MIDDLRLLVDVGEPADVVLEAVLTRSGYLAELEQSDDPQDETRVENLAELVAVAREFVTEAADVTEASPGEDPVEPGSLARLPRAGGPGRRLRPDPRQGRRAAAWSR